MTLRITTLLFALALVACGSNNQNDPDGGGGGTDKCSETGLNDTIDKAVLLDLGAGVDSVECLATGTDVDMFKALAGIGAGGGYVTGTIVGTAIRAQMKVFTQDGTEIAKLVAVNTGQTVPFYFPMASGAELYFSVEDSNGDNFGAFGLTATWHDVTDAHEPNDTRNTAKLIQTGMPVTAMAFTGYEDGPIAAARWEDWYEFDVNGAGAITVAVTNVPSNVRFEVKIFDSSGTELERDIATSSGDNISVIHNAAVGGAFFAMLRAEVSANPPLINDKTEVPNNFTQAYSLLVTGP